MKLWLGYIKLISNIILYVQCLPRMCRLLNRCHIPLHKFYLISELHSVPADLTFAAHGPEALLILKTKCKDNKSLGPGLLLGLSCEAPGTMMRTNLLPNLTGIKRAMMLHVCVAQGFAKFCIWE